VRLDARVHVAIGGLDLRVELVLGDDQVLAVLGPNGAGKTTLLRALAGLVPLDGGHVALDGVVLEDPRAGAFVPPERRHMGVVFQDGLLFPHLGALDNVAFGLHCRGVPRAAARERARAWLARVGLAGRESARPRTLSGGEAQRVALARALAIEPTVLLLDEPLAALDVSTRAAVRRELTEHLRGFRGVRLLVTHDPLEAAILADRVMILESGRVVQDGPPADVTARPRSRWVADLAGVNLLRGTAHGERIELGMGGTLVVAEPADGEVLAVVRPRAVTLHRVRPAGSPRNVWQGEVVSIDDEGSRLRVSVGGPIPIVAEVTRGAVAELSLAPGVLVWVAVKATDITSYPA